MCNVHCHWARLAALLITCTAAISFCDFIWMSGNSPRLSHTLALWPRLTLPITMMMLVVRLMMIFLQSIWWWWTSYLASLLDVELLVGDKEDAVADVEDEDCRLKTKAWYQNLCLKKGVLVKIGVKLNPHPNPWSFECAQQFSRKQKLVLPHGLMRWIVGFCLL